MEEEAEHARRLGLPLLVFLQDADRDEAAEGLARRLEEWVDGRLRTVFATPQDLRKLVRQGIERITSTRSRHPESNGINFSGFACTSFISRSLRMPIRSGGSGGDGCPFGEYL